MQLQMTITLGNVIQIIITLAGVFMAYVAIRERLVNIEVRLEKQLEPIWQQWISSSDRRKSPRT